MKFQITWPKWEKIINSSFVPLMNNRDRFLILYGGRGSSKSDFVAKKLIYRCLNERFFRCLLVRNVYASIAESSYRTLKDVIHSLSLEKLFEFRQNPLEIRCVNGNYFVARGCDDVSKIKSISNVTCVWYEEDLISENDFYTISSSVRAPQAEYLQEIFSINPECDGDFNENWFYKRFFSGHNELSFRSSTDIEVADGKQISLSYTVHHSTYKDNRWLPIEFAAAMQDLKRTNSYYYQIYCLGQWGNKESGSRVYKMFDPSRNVAKLQYDENLALWISFDFNVAPGVSCLISQCAQKELRVIDEIQMRPPTNRTIDVCREFKRRYSKHIAGLFITGDPSGKQEDTRSESSFNDFEIIRGELASYKPSIRCAVKAPNVVGRIGFANQLFEKGFNGAKVIINETCRLLINDLLNGPESSDGTKLKLRVKDRVTGQSWEKYHHFSDAMDYIIHQIYINEFFDYQRGNRPFKITMGKNVSKNRPANW